MMKKLLAVILGVSIALFVTPALAAPGRGGRDRDHDRQDRQHPSDRNDRAREKQQHNQHDRADHQVQRDRGNQGNRHQVARNHDPRRDDVRHAIVRHVTKRPVARLAPARVVRRHVEVKRQSVVQHHGKPDRWYGKGYYAPYIYQGQKPHHNNNNNDKTLLWIGLAAAGVATIWALSSSSQALHQRAYWDAHTAPIGQQVGWNAGTASGAWTPVSEGYDANGDYCREFQQDVWIGGQLESAYGKSCWRPDGSWEFVN